MGSAEATNDVKLTIVEHLEELRDRIIVVAIALVVSMLFSLIYADKILTALIRLHGAQAKVVSIHPVEPLLVWMKIALICGVALSMPVTIYEVVRYLLPALTPQERRYLYILVPGGSISFLVGIAFAILVVLPVGLGFLHTITWGDTVTPMWTIENYVDLATTMMFWLGIIFELPLVMFFLAKLGVVTSKALAKFFRYWIVAAAILAAIITPTPDPINMMIVMGPLILLYLTGIVMVKLAGR
ncbi:MAG: twin-arginine translocase subunit TatC [Anaerolineae bacterium]